MSPFDLQSLPPETRQWLEAKVKSGEFASMDEVLRSLIEEARRLDAEDVEEIRKAVAEGLAELERGEGIPGDQVFEELRRRHFERYGQPAPTDPGFPR
jgi:antitoxin ParD1/3/4